MISLILMFKFLLKEVNLSQNNKGFNLTKLRSETVVLQIITVKIYKVIDR